ncbi:MAG: plasmid maintenance system killer [bacterium]|nr:plasmid maintenance system killer [bacterium]
MIKSFRHKEFKELFLKGNSPKIHPSLHRRALRRLDALDQAESRQELNLPGFDFDPLRGRPKRYSLLVNGPWCITFEWSRGEPYRVDFEQYH